MPWANLVQSMSDADDDSLDVVWLIIS
jgi:hypothetical protein